MPKTYNTPQLKSTRQSAGGNDQRNRNQERAIVGHNPGSNCANVNQPICKLRPALLSRAINMKVYMTNMINNIMFTISLSVERARNYHGGVPTVNSHMQFCVETKSKIWLFQQKTQAKPTIKSYPPPLWFPAFVSPLDGSMVAHWFERVRASPRPWRFSSRQNYPRPARDLCAHVVRVRFTQAPASPSKRATDRARRTITGELVSFVETISHVHKRAVK
jgi:hypothetical protein